MSIYSINPATGKTVQSFPAQQDDTIKSILESAATAQPRWRSLDFSQRSACFNKLARLLRQSREKYAFLITEEMGKLLREASAEVEKCALACEYYAEHAATFLADEPIASDADRSYVSYQPLGVVFCIMPWNFPFWQVLRAAAPAMMAGNTVILKHASNVPRCSLALEEIFREAGFPENTFRSLLITSTQAEQVIASEHIAAVTLTGSEAAGRKVAAVAGSYLKKCVLELGGSDPFIILADTDVAVTASQAVTGRFQNMGQSCIAAKRFILVDTIADEFITHFRNLVSRLRHGDPMDSTTDIAPMARVDLRDDLHDQVERSISMGARLIAGGTFIETQGAYYAPTVLDRVRPGMPAFDEELFGPVAAFVRVRDVEEAIALANQSQFGLGASIWTKDITQGEAAAKKIHAGCTFVNGIVKSDPRLPFGGVKHSGFGRELSYHGIREFVNVKTVWIN
ncbi:succinate-semialdehyde dehydrogenase / glutarate-semialdehyde dehydrogenase [Nitrosomonas sp. Nm51]|uniref:NAD-dependent succinate-semialdehyde dehydrogenase n=1 Tax=Nitrosomonas sp. Nm51 TaxID=133720 RepID=UPI0008B90F93|nr:NAD-dependent succinate-semialdehyde dehydrogenase [Nitrosomonas sp. Nm51]SER55390.1 succinate-semialdehyde dehydrogenase / glutarate-semialdehyde dehydrogenase [Nitrosomonas sp. Nm51]